jgi:hypothetical protein
MSQKHDRLLFVGAALAIAGCSGAISSYQPNTIPKSGAMARQIVGRATVEFHWLDRFVHDTGKDERLEVARNDARSRDS